MSIMFKKLEVLDDVEQRCRENQRNIRLELSLTKFNLFDR